MRLSGKLPALSLGAFLQSEGFCTKTAYGFMALPLHRRSRKHKEKGKIDKKLVKISKLYVQSA